MKDTARPFDAAELTEADYRRILSGPPLPTGPRSAAELQDARATINDFARYASEDGAAALADLARQMEADAAEYDRRAKAADRGRQSTEHALIRAILRERAAETTAPGTDTETLEALAEQLAAHRAEAEHLARIAAAKSRRAEIAAYLAIAWASPRYRP